MAKFGVFINRVLVGMFLFQSGICLSVPSEIVVSALNARISVRGFTKAVQDYLDKYRANPESAPEFVGVPVVDINPHYLADLVDKKALAKVKESMVERYPGKPNFYDQCATAFFNKIKSLNLKEAEQRPVDFGEYRVSLKDAMANFPKESPLIDLYEMMTLPSPKEKSQRAKKRTKTKSGVVWSFGGNNHSKQINEFMKLQDVHARLLKGERPEVERGSDGLCTVCREYEQVASAYFQHLLLPQTPNSDEFLVDLSKAKEKGNLTARFGGQWKEADQRLAGRLRPGQVSAVEQKRAPAVGRLRAGQRDLAQGALANLQCGEVLADEDPVCLLCLINDFYTKKFSPEDSVSVCVLENNEGAESWSYKKMKVNEIILEPDFQGFNLDLLVDPTVFDQISPFAFNRIVMAPKINYQVCKDHIKKAYEIKSKCLARFFCQWSAFEPRMFKASYEELAKFDEALIDKDDAEKAFRAKIDNGSRLLKTAIGASVPASELEALREEPEWIQEDGGHWASEPEKPVWVDEPGAAMKADPVMERRGTKVLNRLYPAYPRREEEDYRVSAVDSEEPFNGSIELAQSNPEQRLRILLNRAIEIIAMNPYFCPEEDFKFDCTIDKLSSLIEKVRLSFAGSAFAMFVANPVYWDFDPKSRFMDFFRKAIFNFSRNLKYRLDKNQYEFLKTKTFRNLLLQEASRMQVELVELKQGASQGVAFEIISQSSVFKDLRARIEDVTSKTTEGVVNPIVFGTAIDNGRYMVDKLDDLQTDLTTLDQVKTTLSGSEIPGLSEEDKKILESQLNALELATRFLGEAQDPFSLNLGRMAAQIAKDVLVNIFYKETVTLEQSQYLLRLAQFEVWKDFLRGLPRVEQPEGSQLSATRRSSDVGDLDLAAWQEYFSIIVPTMPIENKDKLRLFFVAMVHFVHQKINNKGVDYKPEYAQLIKIGKSDRTFGNLLAAIKKSNKTLQRACELEKVFEHLVDVRADASEFPSMEQTLNQLLEVMFGDNFPEGLKQAVLENLDKKAAAAYKAEEDAKQRARELAEQQKAMAELKAVQAGEIRVFEGREGVARGGISKLEADYRRELEAQRASGPVRQLTLAQLYRQALEHKFMVGKNPSNQAIKELRAHIFEQQDGLLLQAIEAEKKSKTTEFNTATPVQQLIEAIETLEDYKLAEVEKSRLLTLFARSFMFANGMFKNIGSVTFQDFEYDSEESKLFKELKFGDTSVPTLIGSLVHKLLVLSRRKSPEFDVFGKSVDEARALLELKNSNSLDYFIQVAQWVVDAIVKASGQQPAQVGEVPDVAVAADAKPTSPKRMPIAGYKEAFMRDAKKLLEDAQAVLAEVNRKIESGAEASAGDRAKLLGLAGLLNLKIDGVKGYSEDGSAYRAAKEQLLNLAKLVHQTGIDNAGADGFTNKIKEFKLADIAYRLEQILVLEEAIRTKKLQELVQEFGKIEKPMFMGTVPAGSLADLKQSLSEKEKALEKAKSSIAKKTEKNKGKFVQLDAEIKEAEEKIETLNKEISKMMPKKGAIREAAAVLIKPEYKQKTAEVSRLNEIIAEAKRKKTQLEEIPEKQLISSLESEIAEITEQIQKFNAYKIYESANKLYNEVAAKLGISRLKGLRPEKLDSKAIAQVAKRDFGDYGDIPEAAAQAQPKRPGRLKGAVEAVREKARQASESPVPGTPGPDRSSSGASEAEAQRSAEVVSKAPVDVARPQSAAVGKLRGAVGAVRAAGKIKGTGKDQPINQRGPIDPEKRKKWLEQGLKEALVADRARAAQKRIRPGTAR